MRASKFVTRLGAAVSCAAILFPAPASAQTSPFVSNEDPAYADLDHLVSEGLVRRVILGERPHSRAAFGRFVEEARVRLDEQNRRLQGRSLEGSLEARGAIRRGPDRRARPSPPRGGR